MSAYCILFFGTWRAEYILKVLHGVKSLRHTNETVCLGSLTLIYVALFINFNCDWLVVFPHLHQHAYIIFSRTEAELEIQSQSCSMLVRVLIQSL